MSGDNVRSHITTREEWPYWTVSARLHGVVRFPHTDREDRPGDLEYTVALTKETEKILLMDAEALAEKFTKVGMPKTAEEIGDTRWFKESKDYPEPDSWDLGMHVKWLLRSITNAYQIHCQEAARCPESRRFLSDSEFEVPENFETTQNLLLRRWPLPEGYTYEDSELAYCMDDLINSHIDDLKQLGMGSDEASQDDAFKFYVAVTEWRYFRKQSVSSQASDSHLTS